MDAMYITPCPLCEKDTPHSTCDGCKRETCNECNYPCSCGGELGPE